MQLCFQIKGESSKLSQTLLPFPLLLFEHELAQTKKKPDKDERVGERVSKREEKVRRKKSWGEQCACTLMLNVHMGQRQELSTFLFDNIGPAVAQSQS